MEKHNILAPYNLFHHILHFTSDICCLDSINLLYVDITIIYTKSDVHIFLHHQGKEPLLQQIHVKTLNISLTETYLTNQKQINLCTQNVEYPLLTHNVIIFYKSAIISAAHDIYDYGIVDNISVV